MVVVVPDYLLLQPDESLFSFAVEKGHVNVEYLKERIG